MPDNSLYINNPMDQQGFFKYSIFGQLYFLSLYLFDSIFYFANRNSCDWPFVAWYDQNVETGYNRDWSIFLTVPYNWLYNKDLFYFNCLKSKIIYIYPLLQSAILLVGACSPAFLQRRDMQSAVNHNYLLFARSCMDLGL